MRARPDPPETRPAFGCAPLSCATALLLDAERNVWIKEYSPPAEEDTNRFLVFDPTGVWLGSVTFPAGLAVSSIGSDYVIGETQDELGVEVVSVHRLEKP